MLIYLKYILMWLFFMVLIAGITIAVPKLAKKFDKWRAEKKAQASARPSNTYMQPLSPDEMGPDGDTPEQKNEE